MGVREEKFRKREYYWAHGFDFRPKSNYDPTLREKFLASKAVAAKQVVSQVQDVEPRNKEGVTSTEKRPLHLQRPYLAEIPTYNYNPGELEPQDPRGIGAIMQSFHDEAATAREAVYTYYEQHKGQEITPALQKEYQKLFARAEKTAERLRIVREIASLVSSTFSAEAIKAKVAEISQSISEIDANQVKQLLVEDAQSVGGALKWLYGLRKDVNRRQFVMLGKIAMVLILGGVGGSALTACTVATEPGYTPAAETTGEENENTQTAATDVAPTMPAPTEPAPTDTPQAEPTATAEAEATLIPSDVMFGSDVPEDDNELRNEYYTYFEQSGIFTPGHPNALVTESSVKIHSDRLAELIGDPANYEGVGYGPGDYIVLDENHQYDKIYGQLVFDGENQIDLSADESYSLQFNEDGALIWASSDPAKETYYWVDWYSDGEFLTQHALVQAVEELQQEADLAEAQAFAEANGLATVDHLEYDDGLNGHTTAFDAEGKPVAEKENEELGWVEVSLSEWAYGPEEWQNTLSGEAMPDTNHTIVYKLYEGWQIGANYYNENFPNGVRLYTPDQFAEALRADGIINPENALLQLPSTEKVGTNSSIDAIYPGFIVGHRVVHVDVAGGKDHQVVIIQSFARDKDGNLVTVLIETSLATARADGDYIRSNGSFFDSVNPTTGEPQFSQVNMGAPTVPNFETAEALYQELTGSNPDDPRLLYLFKGLRTATVQYLLQAERAFTSPSGMDLQAMTELSSNATPQFGALGFGFVGE